MRYISMDAVEPGQLLGRTIFSANGQVLLSENVQLTVYMINTLRRIGVTMLYIKDELYSDIEITDMVSEETKQQVVHKMAELFESLRSGKSFDPRSISVSIDSLLDEIMLNKDVLIQLTDIRTEDNDQYVHALNVCMMSVLIGMNLGLTPSQLKDLAIGALLHDVGKVGLELASEGTGRHHHTWRGFESLKHDFSLLVAHVAFQHHEMIDGSGVPRGLDAEGIHLYAKIVAVANSYDNLLFNRDKDKRMLPHDACEHIMALAGVKLDHEIVIHFLKTVSVYPTGISVRLSTKEIGVVVGQHRGLPSRPIVRIASGGDMGDLQVKEIDLAKHTTIFIEQVLA